jgi:hypothetical protein
MTIKIKYNSETNLIQGNYPSSRNYPNIIIDEEAKTIDGSPYIEITNQEHQDNLGKTMCVIDDIYQEFVKSDSELLKESIDVKRQELQDFHDSTPIRTLLISNTYTIFLHKKYRDLVSEQINDIRIGIEDGDIIEEDAIFDYYYNGDDSYIPVTYLQLKNIYRKMMFIVNANFQKFKEHNSAIGKLTSTPLVDKYDCTTGYLVNQNIDLT